MAGEFYVGYEPQAPRSLARRMRGTVFVLLTTAMTTALLLVGAQSRFSRSVFEFGRTTQFEGLIIERPYPTLLVPRPARTEPDARFSAYGLTVFGKHGAGPHVAGLDGRPVRLRGTLIYHEGQTMVEVEPASILPLDDERSRALAEMWAGVTRQELGPATLVGEIVDAKCFLGVMKPGNLKPHRDCATRCISGGVPPVLVVRDAAEQAAYFLLVSAAGAPVNQAILGRIAEPVQIRGRVVRRGPQVFLEADPESYRSPP